MVQFVLEPLIDMVVVEYKVVACILARTGPADVVFVVVVVVVHRAGWMAMGRVRSRQWVDDADGIGSFRSMASIISRFIAQSVCECLGLFLRTADLGRPRGLRGGVEVSWFRVT